MNELALFAGAGGGILGGKLMGWKTVCAVERDAYAAQVLLQRQNDRMLQPFPIWSDVTTFDGTKWRGLVDVVSGGFPCQDISAAGSGKGLAGERSGLWSSMFRVIREVRPPYAFMENSPILTSRGLGTVLANLAEIGYDAEWDVFGAHDLGLPIYRNRIWILASSRENRWLCEGVPKDNGAERKRTPRKSGAKIGTSLKWFRPCLERWVSDGMIFPMLHETLMAWPIGWTDLRVL